VIAMQRGAVRALRDEPEAENGGGHVEAPPRREGLIADWEFVEEFRKI